MLQSRNTHLQRSLGLLHATASNMSTMVGIGPFITFPLIVSAMGGPLAMLGWIIGAVIAISDGLVWAELSTTIRGEGGSYVYLRESYKKYFGKLMAFLFIWSFLLSGPLEIASGYIGMAHYLAFIIPSISDWQIRALAFLTGLVTIVLHYNRVKFVGFVTVVLWIFMLLTVFLVITVGIFHFNSSYIFPLSNKFSFSFGFLMGLGNATLIAMYDLLGYYNICFVEEEVVNPEYVFPRAIIFSVIAVTLIYASMNFLVLGMLSTNEIINSSHIVTDIFKKFYGNEAAVIITILVAITAYGSIYSLMLSYSRLPFAAARDGFFFSWLNVLHPEKNFPHYSLLLIGGITCIASLFDLGFIISATLSSRILIQFLGQIIGLHLLRKDYPDLKRPFKMWLYPLPSILAFIGFSFIFISSGIEAITLGLGWIILGIFSFLFWAKKHKEWPFAKNNLVDKNE